MGDVPLMMERDTEIASPCKALIAAVVIRAILDASGIYGPSRLTRKEQARAEGWLYAKSMHGWSFEWCCQVLGLKAWRIRLRIGHAGTAKQIINGLMGPEYGRNSKSVSRNRQDGKAPRVLGGMAQINPKGFTWISERNKLQQEREL